MKNTLVLQEILTKQGGNKTSTAFSRNYNQRPWLNLPHQIILNSLNSNGKYYLKLTAQYPEKQIIFVLAI